MKHVAKLRKDSNARLVFSRSDLVLPKAMVRLEMATFLLPGNIKNMMSPILLEAHVETRAGKKLISAIPARRRAYSTKFQRGNEPTNFRLINLVQFIGMAYRSGLFG